ncbi:MAG: LptF/LptG family permease [Gemmatimonadales bacterium]|jgi:lipopolysaccharide export system permease protein|nr:MAG: LptF/LptG family permease [Gemmatimonadales bacterium]
MRLLDRLVAGTFLRLFLLSILATPPLFILGELTERLDDYLDAELAMSTIAEGFLFRFPQFFTWSFPIAGLIAGVFTVYAMTTHREVVAAKAGGVSFHRLFAPVFLLGALITAVGLGLADLVPRANRAAADILDQRRINREFKSQFAFQAENGYTLAVDRLTLSDQRMLRLTLNKEEPSGGQIHIDAETALWEEGRWRLMGGIYRHIPEVGEETAIIFDEMTLAGLTETPEDLIQVAREPEEMTRKEILRRARVAERAGGDTHELRLEMHRRFAIPAATVVILLFGAPLATSSKRGGAAFGIGVSLGSTILYLLLMKVFGGLGESGAIPVEWAAWTPNGLFLVTGLVLLARVRT